MQPTPGCSTAYPVAARTRALDVAFIAVASALAAAAGHVVYNEARFRIFDLFTWAGRDFVWMSALGYLTIFAALALPPMLVARLVPRERGVRMLVTLFGSIAVWALLLLVPRLHPMATLLLAVGVAARLARWAGEDVERGLRLARRWIVLSAVSFGLAALLLGAALHLPERLRLARLPDARADAPNVVLLILDTVRAANLGAYGYPRATTPVLERVAREGVLFEHAFSAAPWTAPSHATLLTGRWPSETGVSYLRPMADSITTLAEVLRDAGYATGGFTANAGYAGHQVGMSRGFAHFEDFPVSFFEALWSTTLAQTGSGQLLVEGLRERKLWKVLNAVRRADFRVVGVRRFEHRRAAEIADRFVAWRDGIAGRPYFAMLNFMDAHAPYEPPGRFRTAFNGGRDPMDRYDGGIAYADSILGALVDRLRARGELDRTILIVTSDHGEQWGEHGMLDHGNALYRTVLHVPLIIRAPGRAPAGLRVESVVSLRDLAATIAEQAGAPGRLPGQSLSSVWTIGDTGGVSPAIAEVEPSINPGPRNRTRKGAMKAAIDARWYYILNGDGSEELFAWRDSPDDGPNRAHTVEGRAVAARRHELIMRTLKAEAVAFAGSSARP